MFKSKVLMSVVLVAVIIVICTTFSMRGTWWSFIDVFCFFMAAFMQLMALTLGAKIPSAGKQFSVMALVFALGGVIALIGEAIAWYFIF